MDKMERFLLKGPGKLDMVVGAIVCLALFFAYRIGLVHFGAGLFA